jgi:transcriptional regulator with XRE-family HTH domain
MPERFGDLLRQQRRKADKTLGDVARLLGVSVVFLSDVERGNRRPLSNERLIRIAEFLGQDPAPLIEAADRERGFIEYDIRKARPLEANVVGGLVAGLARGGVTDEQLHDIQKILNGEDDDDDE